MLPPASSSSAACVPPPRANASDASHTSDHHLCTAGSLSEEPVDGDPAVPSQQETKELARLEVLPLPLFHHVMGFALSCTHKAAQQKRTSAERDLDEIGLISKAVRVHATEIHGQLALGKMLLWVSSGTRKEMLELRRDVLARRVFLREMEVNVFPPTSLTERQASEWLHGVLHDVAAMVRMAPQLELLDLSACCGDVSCIVEAAGKHCSQLQALLLPTDRTDDTHGRSGHLVDMVPTMDALFEGMVHWHRRTGGLRQLRIPSRQASDRYKNAVEFLEHITAFCPSIELLDAAVSQWHLEEGLDEWIIDRAIWEKFCETCCHLREFDWVTVPWATDFFEIFAKYPKPQLTQLTLTTTMQWNWDTYLEQIGRVDADAIKLNGYGGTAHRVHFVLKACPALKRLTITANSRVSNDEATLDAMLDLEEYDPRQAPLPYKRQNAINQGLFGDNFCRALVRHCPLLEEFRLTEDHRALAATMKRVRPIVKFQDAALEALAQLKHLAVVDVKAVNISGKGLFRLVNTKVCEAHGTRCYDFAIGDERGALTKSFYTAMLEFLQCMLDAGDDLRIPSERIYLCVINGNTSPVDARLSEMFLIEVKNRIRDLRAKYPTVTFRVETDGLTNTSFSTIYGFGLYTEHAVHPVDSRWIDLPEEALRDNVFILEEVMDDLHDDGGHGEEDEEFDDEFDVDDHEEDEWETDEDFDEEEEEEEEGVEEEDEEEDDDVEELRGRPHGRRRRRRHPVNWFNGVALPDVGALTIHDDPQTTDTLGDDDADDFDDHAFDDQDGYDY